MGKKLYQDLKHSVGLAIKEEMINRKDRWELEVYRNINNLCVWCGKPMFKIVFYDIPVCKDHLTK